MKKRIRLPLHLQIEEDDDRRYLLRKRGINDKQFEYLNKHNNGKTTYFNSLVACTYGVNAAIVFNFISYFTIQNEKNEIKNNFRRDRYWVYGSIETFNCDYLPFLTISQIRTALKILQQDRIIIKGSFNKHKYDRTLWYAINTERFKRIFEIEHYDLIKS